MISFRALSNCKNNNVFLGQYPQTAHGDKMPIEWVILDKYDSNILLISKYALITSPYIDVSTVKNNFSYSDVQWETCAARHACIDFFNEAFSAKEKSMIDKISSKGLYDACEDHVFMLSESEVIKYFPMQSDRQTKPSDYAKQTGAMCGLIDGQRTFTSWWIKPHIEIHESKYGTDEIDGRKCYYNLYPKAVFHNGGIQYHSRNMFHSDFTIRPCILMKNNGF